MSKLDDMYDRLGIINGHSLPETAEEMRTDLTLAIESLFLELIGEYRDNTDSDTPQPEYDDHISVGYNMKIDELRQKVNEL